MQTPDHELMARCGQGDAAAFETIVRRWEGRIGRMLRRLVTDETEAEDLRQEVFVRVLTASRRYRPQAEFSTWLYRVVVNAARDSARKNSRRPQSLDQPIVDGNGHPAQAAEEHETREVVEAALQALSDEHREVLVLRHYGELSFPRIAEVLDEPETTLKSRAKAALDRLYHELRRRGITNGELHE